MKTLITKDTRVSKYVFEDEAEVIIQDNLVITPNFVIADLNSSNAEIVEDVVVPEDWTGCKYLLAEDSSFVLNPDYTEPEVVQ